MDDAEKLRQFERLKQSMIEHRRKMETDPEYRKQYEEEAKEVDEALTSWPNDTED